MKRPAQAIGVILAIVAIDQAIKWIVETTMALQERIDILPFFALYRTHNFGIAFSMLWDAGPLVLVGVALAVIGFVLWLWWSSPRDRVIAHWGYALIIGGAIGNMIDRVLLGYVVDYFLFFTEGWSFAVFNLADSAITVGAGLVILDEFLDWRRNRALDRDQA